jgi:hypothetical protein
LFLYFPYCSMFHEWLDVRETCLGKYRLFFQKTCFYALWTLEMQI